MRNGYRAPSPAGKAMFLGQRCSRIVAFPNGEGFVSGILLSPSNLRPFGAPPSIGKRECPREPLPLEGAAERSEAGLASFLRRSGALANGVLETISPRSFSYR